MAARKEIRTDKTYIISQNNTDNPKLGAKILSDGRESLFLDYYFGYTKTINEKTGKEGVKIDRSREFLKLYLWQAPRTPMERQQNKDTLELARKIRSEREQELLEGTMGYRVKQHNLNLYNYWANFVDGVRVADKRLLRCVLKSFQRFITESEKYNRFRTHIEPKNLSRDMMQDFVYYLEDHHRGEGVQTYWKRFKRLINYAVEHKVIKESPCKGIKVVCANDILTKDILSQEEMQLLFSTHYERESTVVRRAFALTCLTGIRHCDVKRLSWKNIDFANRTLTYRQSKTAHDSNASGVVIPLNDTLINIIGEKPEGANDCDLVFDLPTMEACLKVLRKWTKKAGIQKHITWHCGRHSFATNILSNGANIKVTSTLLGHSSLKYTEKYLRAVDELKRKAIDSLPTLDI